MGNLPGNPLREIPRVAGSYTPTATAMHQHTVTCANPRFRAMTPPMLSIDLTGKHALVAGVADHGGFGFAIAKALAEAGAPVSVASWPPAMGVT